MAGLQVVIDKFGQVNPPQILVVGFKKLTCHVPILPVPAECTKQECGQTDDLSVQANAIHRGVPKMDELERRRQIWDDGGAAVGGADTHSTVHRRAGSARIRRYLISRRRCRSNRQSVSTMQTPEMFMTFCAPRSRAAD